MKSSISFIRLVVFFTVLGLFSSCGSNLLITKADYRHLDLVKVESSERDFSDLRQISEDIEEVLTVIELDEQELAYIKVSFDDPGERLASRRSVIIPDRETRKVIRQIHKGQDHLIRAGTEEIAKEKSSMFNILRLLLYILIALLVITILGLVLPGYLVTIVVLVLLILALLYLLGLSM